MSEIVLSRLLSMSRAIAGEMDRQSVLDKVAGELRFLIPHDHLDLALLTDGGRLNITYEVGIHTGWTEPEALPHPVESAPIREVLRGEVPYLATGNALEDPRFHFEGALDEPIFDAKLRSRIHVPLRVHGKVIGSLNISRHAADAYGEREVRVAQDVADVLAPYLRAITRAEQARRAAVARSEATAREEMLRVGAQRLTEGMERERQRLGMDLHDQTLADLTRLARRLATLRSAERIAGEDLDPLEDELATCMQELRGIIEDTRPGVLELFGFAQAVEALLLRSVDGIDPAIAISIRDDAGAVPDALPDEVRTSLYRIAQEAINNAVRHGSPSSVQVSIAHDAGHLVIEILDDGVGLDERALHNASGISHMRTRAALLSADFDIGPAAGGEGTRIAVSLAVDQATTHSCPTGAFVGAAG